MFMSSKEKQGPCVTLISVHISFAEEDGGLRAKSLLSEMERGRQM